MTVTEPIQNIPDARILIIQLSRADDGSIGLPRIQYVNTVAAKFLGYTVQDLIDKNLDVIYPYEKLKNLWRSAINQLTATQAAKTFQGEVVHKDQHAIPVVISMTALFGENRLANHVLVSLHDPLALAKPVAAAWPGQASELNPFQCREVETALVESEERFRQMADMAGEWLWEQDPEGYYIYSSTAVNQILGFSQKEVIGKHYTQFLTAQDKAHQQSYAAIQNPFFGLTNHYQHRDGHLVITESTGLPIIAEDGRLLKWRGVDRDITARKQFQDALIESEQRTRLIIESSLSAIVIMDSYGVISDWNRQAEHIFGWSRAEAIGQPLDQIIIPERFRQAHREGLQRFLRTGEASMFDRLIEQTALRRDRSEFPVELSISVMKEGNAYRFSAFIHDISSRKAAEQEIRQGQVKLAIARNEIDIARQIQVSLAPSSPIDNEHFEVTGYCLPADQVGGDYYDYFLRDQHRLEMVIADVSGHSIGPGLFMVEARSAIRALANGQETPSEKMALLNGFLFDDLDKSDFFITLFYLQYDALSRQLCYANAGHPPPLLFKTGLDACISLDADGLIFGVDKSVDFEQRTTQLAGGDVVLLYTDGLTEAQNERGEFFGKERVCDLLRQNSGQSPQQLIALLLDSLKQFSRSEVYNDDITLMVLKCR